MGPGRRFKEGTLIAEDGLALDGGRNARLKVAGEFVQVLVQGLVFSLPYPGFVKAVEPDQSRHQPSEGLETFCARCRMYPENRLKMLEIAGL